MVSNRQVGLFIFQVFLGWKMHDIFGRKRNTLWMISLKKSVCFSQHQTVFFRSAQFRKNAQKTTLAFFPSKQLVSGLQAFSKKWGVQLEDWIETEVIIGRQPQTLHYYRETPSKSPYILRQVWYPSPKWGNLMTPAETPPQKMRHAWQNPSFLGRIPRNLSANTAFDHICAWYLKWFASGGSSANDPLESHWQRPNRPGNAREKLSRTMLIWNSSWLHGWKFCKKHGWFHGWLHGYMVGYMVEQHFRP